MTSEEVRSLCWRDRFRVVKIVRQESLGTRCGTWSGTLNVLGAVSENLCPFPERRGRYGPQLVARAGQRCRDPTRYTAPTTADTPRSRPARESVRRSCRSWKEPSLGEATGSDPDSHRSNHGPRWQARANPETAPDAAADSGVWRFRAQWRVPSVDEAPGGPVRQALRRQSNSFILASMNAVSASTTRVHIFRSRGSTGSVMVSCLRTSQVVEHARVPLPSAHRSPILLWRG